MSDRSKPPILPADDLEPCVALIGRDAGGALVITACNDPFRRLSDAAGKGEPTFPVAFDILFPGAEYGAFRDGLIASFMDREADAPQPMVDFRHGSAAWRFSIKRIRQAAEGARAMHALLLTGIDVRVKRETAAAPDANTSRYRALVDLAYDAIVTMNEQHNITLFNRAAENLFGYTAAEVLGKPIVTLLPEKFRADHRRKVQQFADTYQPSVRQATPPKMDDTNSVFGQHRDGSIIPVEIAVSKIELNGAIEFMAVVRDITDRARLMTLLKTQASTDALTGLPNRRGFLEFAQKALGSGEPLSVFILDIDLFKDINDSHGHDAGDEVLRALAKVGESMTPQPHLFARWGGEEFVAALPGTDATHALQIADALRLRFERQTFQHEWPGAPIPFTVSIGVVTCAEGERDVEALMKRADIALYRAKASGRNRVELG